MNQQPPTPYDQVLYPSLTHVQTHPDRSATIATLFGMQSAPVEKCRVLEIGCGDGTNLISMAYELPGSEFVGIDAADRAIAEGKQTIGDLSLHNVQLQHGDLMGFTEDGGAFDYIIAHRDFTALVDALTVLVQAGEPALDLNGARVTEPEQIRKIITDELPISLERLARSVVLVG